MGPGKPHLELFLPIHNSMYVEFDGEENWTLTAQFPCHVKDTDSDSAFIIT